MKCAEKYLELLSFVSAHCLMALWMDSHCARFKLSTALLTFATIWRPNLPVEPKTSTASSLGACNPPC